MLKNYLKIGFRNLLKNKLFSLINISGMAISMASFLLIALFIADELKYDKHIKDVELKYRVYNEFFYDDGRKVQAAMIPPTITPALKAEFPEVESYARIMNISSSILLEVDDKKFTENEGGYADPDIFNMFSLELVEGDKRTALTAPNTIAISQTLAEKYFGEKPALGEPIQVSNENYTVGAVFKDFPAHSHLHLNYMLAMTDLTAAIPERMESWHWNQFHSYIKLKPGTDAANLEGKLKDLAERKAWPSTKPRGYYYIPHLMAVQDIHLKASDHQWDIAERGNAQTIYILSATGIFILIIAILNFINLSTARAVNRIKEVGVRKVVGAYRTQLIYQFISESVIISLIALLIGGLMAELLLPVLNSFTGKSIPAMIFFDPLLLGGIIIFALIIGVAAGAYPAFYISGYKPVQILSGKQSIKSGKNLLRKGLVVLQFILSFLLIVAALVVSEQHQYMRTKDMGFNKENLVVLPLRGEMGTSPETAKNTFLEHPGVLSGTLGYGLPGEAFAGDVITDKENNKELPISMLTVDHDYVATLGLELIAGRDFSKDFPSDELEAFIVSETGARLLGHTNPENAIGHKVAWNRWDADSLKEGKVVGVVKDFHLNSLKEEISPVILHVYPFAYSTLSLKVKDENLPATMAQLEATWKQFNSEWPFEYRFLDGNFDKMYKAEENLATLFTYFTGFTIFVACLGLFGLVVYSTSQRYKEISIRKVLGAAESTLVVQLAKNYMILIVVAFVIAIPFSYYAADQWLQKFAFRIDVSAMLFVKAALLIMIIALVTVGFQALKAAKSNPVNALKEQ